MVSTLVPIFIGFGIAVISCVSLVMRMAEEAEKQRGALGGAKSGASRPWTAVRAILIASALISLGGLIVALVIGDLAFTVLTALMTLFSGVALGFNWSPPT